MNCEHRELGADVEGDYVVTYCSACHQTVFIEAITDILNADYEEEVIRQTLLLAHHDQAA
jgi:hypothetical protein